MRLLAFLGVFWILRKLLGYFFTRQAGRARSNPDTARGTTKTVKDPECGMYMDPRLAIRVQYKGKDVFFCSEECRDKYMSKKQPPQQRAGDGR